MQTIFSTLASWGRLSASQVAQRCHLPVRYVLHSLSVLVHRHFIYFHVDEDRRTIYEANPAGVIRELRLGKMLHCMHGDLGQQYKAVLRGLALNGHQSLDQMRKSRDYLVSTHETDSTMMSVLRTLINNGAISRLRSAHAQSRSDARADMLLEISDAQLIAKDKKTQAAREEKINEGLGRKLDSAVDLRELESCSHKKRAADHLNHEQASKKSKTTESTSEILHDSVPANLLDEAQCLTFDIHYATNALRSYRLVSRAIQRYGFLAGQVLRASLSQAPKSGVTDSTMSERRSSSELEPQDFVINMGRLLLDVNARGDCGDDDANLERNFTEQKDSASVGQPSTRNGQRTTGHTNGGLEFLTGSPISMEMIEDQLAILSEDPSGWIRSESSQGGYVVDLQKVIEDAREAELLTYVKARFGAIASRIVRILLAHGRLDERRLQELGLFPARDLRQNLAFLQTSGLIALQEVPRDIQRQTGRTLYLWFFDIHRARNLLLEDTRKAISRLLQKLSLDRKLFSTLLAKAEQPSVRGKEEQTLSSSELRSLSQWKLRERRIWMEVDRLDSTIGLIE